MEMLVSTFQYSIWKIQYSTEDSTSKIFYIIKLMRTLAFAWFDIPLRLS